MKDTTKELGLRRAVSDAGASSRGRRDKHVSRACNACRRKCVTFFTSSPCFHLDLCRTVHLGSNLPTVRLASKSAVPPSNVQPIPDPTYSSRSPITSSAVISPSDPDRVAQSRIMSPSPSLRVAIPFLVTVRRSPSSTYFDPRLSSSFGFASLHRLLAWFSGHSSTISHGQ